uniref:Ycf55 n=1 Tax=Yamadaella caenomyce TaxID=259029 RepID=A0A1G4NYX3_9FLOR|nr:Hypothetical protein ycf55 [Yamadaella caenomyce]SCW23716.1 Hypothetical protein ycf55 [Yamadaella caenomyce]
MITYWPKKPGTELNSHVASLFKKVYIKLNFNLYNKTSQILSIDILDACIKQELFKIVLLELEILILDIIELDINVSDIHLLNKRMLIDLVSKSMYNFVQVCNTDTALSKNLYFSSSSILCRRISMEHKLLLNNLVVYLVFGTSGSSMNAYLFPLDKTPVQHVEILLDNLVIQLADLIFFKLVNSEVGIADLFKFLKVNRMCRNTYVSARSIATFKNNLLWNNHISYYIQQPRIIYNNRYQVWIFSTKGLHCQYIYAYREDELVMLSKIQTLVIILLEIQDFVLPKFQALVLSVGRLWIYGFRYLITNSFKMVVKSIAILTRVR